MLLGPERGNKEDQNTKKQFFFSDDMMHKIALLFFVK